MWILHDWLDDLRHLDVDRDVDFCQDLDDVLGEDAGTPDTHFDLLGHLHNIGGFDPILHDHIRSYANDELQL